MVGENIWKKDNVLPEDGRSKDASRQSERNPSIHPIDPSEGTKKLQTTTEPKQKC